MEAKGAVAIITARGGSKRIPHKNIRNFCGRPIIEYSIEAAKMSGAFDTVMVSTDDEEIAAIAKRAGAEIPFLRSAATAGDYATTAEVLCEVLEQYEKAGKTFAYGCCIYPTAPFVTAEKLSRAMRELREQGRDCVMPVAAFSFPPLRGMTLADGGLHYKWEQYAACRSQDLEELYHDCGQFYAFCTEHLRKTGKLVAGNIGGIVVSELEMQDIDNETDWKLAEMKYRLLSEKEEQGA